MWTKNVKHFLTLFGLVLFLNSANAAQRIEISGGHPVFKGGYGQIGKYTGDGSWAGAGNVEFSGITHWKAHWYSGELWQPVFMEHRVFYGGCDEYGCYTSGSTPANAKIADRCGYSCHDAANATAGAYGLTISGRGRCGHGTIEMSSSAYPDLTVTWNGIMLPRLCIAVE